MGVVSLDFLLLTAVTFIIYWIIPNIYKKYVLIISSIIFCASYGLYPFLFTLIYTILTFFFAKLVNDKKGLCICIIVALIPLLLNKYILKDGISILGISFLSFRAISYLVDKYRNKISNVCIFDYILYLLFFPALLSGPIEKASIYINKINDNKVICWNDFVSAIITICYGLVLKIVLADSLSSIINVIYDNYEIYTKYCLLSIMAYPIYIYCDFAGYSYMACGVGKMFGYELTINFNQPYFSTSIKEFWNRWHISLNKWFIEYVYIPLGGNRKGRIRQYLNILIVFILSGIWHGAGFGFVMWGLLNAIYQIIGNLTIDGRDKIYEKLGLNNTWIQKVVRVACTYLLLSFTWIFFARGFDGGIEIIKSLFMYRKLGLMDFMLNICGKLESSKIAIIILTIIVLLMIVIDYINYKKQNISMIIAKKNVLIRYATLIILIVIIVLFGKYGLEYNPNNFIYFDF